MSLFNLIIAATPIRARPDPSGLPGSPALQQLVNGLAFWCLAEDLRRSLHGGPNRQIVERFRDALGRSTVSAFVRGAIEDPADFGQHLVSNGYVRALEVGLGAQRSFQ